MKRLQNKTQIVGIETEQMCYSGLMLLMLTCMLRRGHCHRHIEGDTGVQNPLKLIVFWGENETGTDFDTLTYLVTVR